MSRVTLHPDELQKIRAVLADRNFAYAGRLIRDYVDAGVSQEYLAGELRMSPRAVWRKVHGR